jgi:hypothetical protein
LIERKRIAFIHVGDKIAVCLLMLSRRRQIEDHKGREGVDARDRHVRHVAKLRDRFVGSSYEGGDRSHGIIFKRHAFFQSADEKIVRDGSACERVLGEDYVPDVGTGGSEMP